MHTYSVEITDTFGGDANYTWVTRHVIRARSPRGVATIMNRQTGLGFRKTDEYGDMTRYDSASGATCMFVQESEHA